MRKEKKKKRTDRPALARVSSKQPMIFSSLLFLLTAMVVYLFSPYTQIQALTCTGNYYYSPQQIYSLAEVEVNRRTYLNSSTSITRKLEADPLIETAEVSQNGQNLNISVQEKTIIGYYEQDGKTILVTSDKERIPVENETEIRTLIHFPLLVDLSEETIDAIADTVQANPEYLTRQEFEKIAEISPWSESYDNNMLKLVLQDGNTAFTSIDSLFMMSTYQRVLDNLQGENVCLMLDGERGSVQKIGCEYRYLSPEERAQSRAIPKEVIASLFPNMGLEVPSSSEESTTQPETADQAQPQADQPAEAAAQPEDGQPDQTQEQSTEETAAPESPAAVNGVLAVDPAGISDWTMGALWYMNYSPSTGLFYSTLDGLYYTYDEASDTFTPIQ